MGRGQPGRYVGGRWLCANVLVGLLGTSHTSALHRKIICERLHFFARHRRSWGPWHAGVHVHVKARGMRVCALSCTRTRTTPG